VRPWIAAYNFGSPGVFADDWLVLDRQRRRFGVQTWLVDSFFNEGGERVKVSFSGIDFNLPCGSEGIALTNQPQPSGG
jgi:hypothetical protein